MKQVIQSLIFCSLFILVVGCQSNKEELDTSIYTAEEYSVLSQNLNLPESPYSYSFGNADSDRAINHKGTFGRALFYDKKLSADRAVSCASCHQQELAFADNVSLSQGANGNIKNRNSLALGSLRSFGAHYDEAENIEVPGLFWDERAGSIKEQLKQTINNPNEMGMEISLESWSSCWN